MVAIWVFAHFTSSIQFTHMQKGTKETLVIKPMKYMNGKIYVFFCSFGERLQHDRKLVPIPFFFGLCTFFSTFIMVMVVVIIIITWVVSLPPHLGLGFGLILIRDITFILLKIAQNEIFLHQIGKLPTMRMADKWQR